MVEIQITGVRYTISDKVRAYVEEKFSGMGRFHSGLKQIHVTIHEGEKFGFRVDVEMHLPHGPDVIAHDSEETVYSAIDITADKTAAQLRKWHSKHSGHRSVSQRLRA